MYEILIDFYGHFYERSVVLGLIVGY